LPQQAGPSSLILPRRNAKLPERSLASRNQVEQNRQVQFNAALIRPPEFCEPHSIFLTPQEFLKIQDWPQP
jgi:hypothetical protein